MGQRSSRGSPDYHRPLVTVYQSNGETFGDYCARHGVEKLGAKVGLEVPKDKHAKEASEG